MRVVQLDQKSNDWLEWRNKGIGSSDAPVLWTGKHFGRTIEDLWHEKIGDQTKTKKRKINLAMNRGVELEPVARRLYADMMGHFPEPLCCIHDEYPWCKASLDGWLDAPRIAIEIKVPGVRWDGSCDHYDALEGKIPDKYRAQLLHQCLATGAKGVHYISYSPDSFPGPRKFILVKFRPMVEELQKLERLEKLFWRSVEERVHPSTLGLVTDAVA